MRKILSYILLFAVTLTVSADGLSRQDKVRYAYFFQGAMARLNANDERGAMDLLLHCKDIDPQAAETYFFLADCYEHLGNDSMRVAMMVKAAELRPDNDVYKEALIPIYLNNNEIDKATVLVEEIVAATPERTDMLQMLVQIYSYTKDNKNLLKTLNRLEVQEGQNEQLTMAKVRVYSNLGDDKLAYNELRSLCDNHPLDLNYRVMLGNWLLQHDKKKEAVQHYREVLNEEPDNEMALMSIMDFYRSEHLDSLADMSRENLLRSPKIQPDTRIILLKQFIIEQEHKSTDSTAVLQLFDRVMETSDGIDIMELKLAYMAMKNMPEESIKQLLVKILDKQPEHTQARMQLMQMAAEKKDYDEMIRLTEPAQQYNPDEWAFSYYLGFALMMQDRLEESARALQTASEHVDEKDDKTLATEMYSMLGEAYYKLGRKEESFKAFDNCLRLDPDNVLCLNNYAYYLSEIGEDLDRAATMSLKAVKAEPNNSTYLDTYAWVLYKQGRYEEAKIYMEMAIEKLSEGESKDVYQEHLDEINKAINH